MRGNGAARSRAAQHLTVEILSGQIRKWTTKMYWEFTYTNLLNGFYVDGWVDSNEAFQTVEWTPAGEIARFGVDSIGANIGPFPIKVKNLIFDGRHLVSANNASQFKLSDDRKKIGLGHGFGSFGEGKIYFLDGKRMNLEGAKKVQTAGSLSVVFRNAPRPDTPTLSQKAKPKKLYTAF
jgi:hypothetical protein